MNRFTNVLTLLLVAGVCVFLTGCKGDNDPQPENVPELITKVTLVFSTPGGTPVIVTATDPDGEGVQDIRVDGGIVLKKGLDYTLDLQLINGLYNPGEEGYDISGEVLDEGDEHQFFFRWSEGVFSSPTGTGNIKDDASTPVGTVTYADQDKNGRGIGLSTSWTTAANTSFGKSFRVMLKHQPDIKTGNSTSLDGETDLDISFTINVE